MKRLCLLAAVLLFPSALPAQSPASLPIFYKSVDRVVWVVRNLAAFRKTWTPLGLTNVKEYRNLTAVGNYRGHAVTIHCDELVGNIRNLNVELIQPAADQHDAFSDFLAQHGEGIFAIVSAVSSEQLVQHETTRLHAFGVDTLQHLTINRDNAEFRYTWFDTEPQGKYVIGLLSTSSKLYDPGVMADSSERITHFGTLVRDPKAVSAFWHKLGFPAFNVGTEPARADFRYRDQPLTLNFGTAASQYSQFTNEWVRSDSTPDNIYGDFYKAHHNQEGIQHLGVGVHDLKQTVSTFNKAGFEATQSGHWNAADGKEIPYVGMEPGAGAGGVTAELVQILPSSRD